MEKYILTQRPPSIGTHPVDGLLNVTPIHFKNRESFVLEYDRVLDYDEVRRFELTPFYNESINNTVLNRRFAGVYEYGIVTFIDLDKIQVKWKNEEEAEIMRFIDYWLLEISLAELFDADKAKVAQKEYCELSRSPHFAPYDGFCYRCKDNIYVQKDRGNYKTGISVERAQTGLITGCPHCNYSYCD